MSKRDEYKKLKEKVVKRLNSKKPITDKEMEDIIKLVSFVAENTKDECDGCD